jgi:dihydrolipoamide dehydrogenase
VVHVEEVDTLTLGAGGGAYPAGFALARAGRHVVMVDPKGVTSGNCLAEGCVPSKAVFEAVELHRRLAGPLGRAAGGPGGPPDYGAILAWKDGVQRRRYRQHDRELAASPSLELVAGTGRLVDPHTVDVTTADGVRRYRAASILVATGADVFVPPLEGAQLCVTSRDLFALEPSVTTLPSRLAVIGGGYIGLEAACLYRALGVEVTVIEALPTLLSGMDPDFVALVAAGLDPSITVHLSSPVTKVTRHAAGLRVHYRDGDVDRDVDADVVLLAVGRRPVLPDGASELGLALAGHGLAVDAAMRVLGYEHLYAPGDVNGRSMLFHSAVRQSLVAAHNILAGNRVVDRVDFDAVPATVFTTPTGAFVGLTRATGAARGVELVEAAYALEEDSRAQIVGETDGEIRLFFEAGSLRLRGGWVVGVDAAQLIGQIGEATAAGLSAYDLARFADQHPMAAEGIGRAARSLVG